MFPSPQSIRNSCQCSFFSPSFSPLCFVLFNFLSSVDLFREGRFGGRELMSLVICFLIAVKGLRVGLLLSCDVTVGLTYTAGTGALQSLIDRGPVLLPLYLESCENKNGRHSSDFYFSISQGRSDLQRRMPYGSVDRSPCSFLWSDAVGRNACLGPQAVPLAHAWTELTSQRSPIELVLNNRSIVQMCCTAQI